MIEFNAKTYMNTIQGRIPLDIQFQARTNSIVCLFGASGAGKTTALRMLAGLVTPVAGTIMVNNEIWFSSQKHINLPVRKRKIGYVFQEYSLFPHLTVRDNISFASGRNEPSKWVDNIIESVGLTELAGAKPSQLSGGQKQRVAFARALARKPDVLLLDEPLSALDNEMRYSLQEKILEMHSIYPITTILVSHDISEVFKMANQVYVIERGQIVKSGTPKEIWTLGNTSGKFKFAGELLDIIQEDYLYILTVAIGNNIIRVVSCENEIKNLCIGDKVIVSSKAFNPIVIKATV